MKRQNKDGRPIFSNTTWDKMLKSGRLIESQGYAESGAKPNLFFRKIETGVLYADMRGTDIVPIWDDTRPMLYFFPTNPPMNDDERRSILKPEFARLKVAGCEPRFSFYETSEEGGLFVDDPDYLGD